MRRSLLYIFWVPLCASAQPTDCGDALIPAVKGYVIGSANLKVSTSSGLRALGDLVPGEFVTVIGPNHNEIEAEVIKVTCADFTLHPEVPRLEAREVKLLGADERFKSSAAKLLNYNSKVALPAVVASMLIFLPLDLDSSVSLTWGLIAMSSANLSYVCERLGERLYDWSQPRMVIWVAPKLGHFN